MANWTGNAYVDSLLLGEKWDTTNLTYFLKGGSFTWNSYETAAIEATFASWSDVANLTFTQIFNEAGADLVENQGLDSAGNLGVHTIHNDYTTSTLQANGTQLSGVFNSVGYGWDSAGLAVGGLGYLTLVHEIGHGLGLDHTHDDGGGNVNFFPGVTNPSSLGNNSLNQDVYSVMSYVHGYVGKYIDGNLLADGYGFVAGPMAFDIAAIQYAYGANLTKNAGNNTYILPDSNSAGTFFSAIWDAGGTDEIVYQGSTNTTIDLRSATLADENGGGGFLSNASSILGGFTIAADFTNALDDVNGETGVIIENASGGSGDDTLTGNNVANVLNGNAGNDNITARAGNDTLNGGEGIDSLNGNEGNDTIIGGYDADEINGGVGDDIIYGDNIDGSGRSVTASGISLGTGQINKAGGNVSIATAQDVSNEFSYVYDGEIGNSKSTPHVSVLGTGDGNVDYYKITLLNSNVTIVFDIDHAKNDTSPENLDSEISIYLADGTLVKNNDDNAGDSGSTGTSDSALTHTFADAGTYYIAVGAYAAFSTDPGLILTGGTYELQISVSGELVSNNDIIDGGDGNDIIRGGAGADQLFGGAGNDTIYFDAADDLDNVYGGFGTDTLVVTSGIAPTSFNLALHEFESARQELTDTAGASWSTITNIFDVNWNLSSETAINDDSSSTISTHELGAASWDISTLSYDTNGAQTQRFITYDAGSSLRYGYDTTGAGAGAQDWLQEFSDLGNTLTRYTDFDQNSDQVWTSTYNLYDGAGLRTQQFISYDDTSSARYGYVANGDTDWLQENYNTGTLQRYTDYDQAGNQTFIEFYDLYDTAGVQTQKFVTYDNGTSGRFGYDAAGNVDWLQENRADGTLQYYTDFDQAGTATWEHFVNTYDVDGTTVLSRHFFNDDGTDFIL